MSGVDMMKNRQRIGWPLVLSAVAMLALTLPAGAVKITAFGSGPLQVRMCPNTCPQITGHALRPGGRAAIFETKDGWARVSGYLLRENLTPKYGDAVPRKPALWVPLSAFDNAADPAPTGADGAPAIPAPRPAVSESEQDDVEQPKPKPVARSFATPVRLTTPTFRPADADAPVQAAMATPAVEETADQVVVKNEPEPEAKPERVVEAEPAPEAPQGTVANVEPVTDPIVSIVEKAPQRTQAEPAEPVAVEKVAETETAAAAPATEEIAQLAKPEDPTKAQTSEPTFKSAVATPVELGERPDTLTDQLLDKRLKSLPGGKSKQFKTEEVIALRHHALGLLNSNECKGIDRGGRASQKGVLYVVCTDDPTYLRLFPLQETSW